MFPLSTNSSIKIVLRSLDKLDRTPSSLSSPHPSLTNIMFLFPQRVSGFRFASRPEFTHSRHGRVGGETHMCRERVSKRRSDEGEKRRVGKDGEGKWSRQRVFGSPFRVD